MDRSFYYSLIGHLVVIGSILVAAHISARPMSSAMNIYHVSAVSSQSIASLIQKNTPVQSKPKAAVPQIRTATKTLPQQNVKKSQAAKSSSSSPSTAISNKPAESSGMSGIKTDTAFEYPEYLMELQQRIRENWHPPFSRASLNTRVYFKISRDGKVLQAFIEQPTQNRIFDSAARNAVIACDPFPPLPEKYEHDELGIHFDFIFNAN